MLKRTPGTRGGHLSREHRQSWQRHHAGAAVTMSPGPMPFVNKMKWVKWLPVGSELNVKLSENTKAAEGWVRKGSILSRLHLAVSVGRHTSASIFTPNAGHTLRGMLLNTGFPKALFDLFTSSRSK